ncbi:MAG: SPOR domain-containing protein [Desulfosarcinaceae bacterium]|nr:SPOR domain-containing protein [Desulfosarcinaceae bacterium]
MLSHALRHLALRLWLTVVVGGLGSLALVPLLQALMGLDWVALPVFGFLGLVFLGIGWVLNAWASHLVERLRAEAAIWERAGMRREATQRYQALVGVVDSFLLSPGRRRQMLAKLLPKLTRFHLDQDRPGPVLDRLLRAHLEIHPGDAAMAVKWLRIQIGRQDPPPWTHELAQQIGEASSDSADVTALLVRFYLANGRSDHAAIDTYRRCWRSVPDFRTAKAVALAQLLSMEGHRNLWALDVYLTAWSQGAPQDQLAAAIRRCVAVIRPTEEGRPLLEQARALLGRQLPASQPPPAAPPRVSQPSDEERLDPFTLGSEAVAPQAPSSDDTAAAYRYRRRPRSRPATETWIARTRRELGSRLLAIGPGLRRTGQWALIQLRSTWGKTAGFGILALALIVLISNTVQHLQPSPSAPPPPEPAAAPAVTDPFTIQVAAYLKAEDARRYAERLKANGLDAYWTEAVGASRNWYQVRIDHFATKAAARKFGQDLKAKGLINDFYVANYRPPQLPGKN